MAFQCNAFQRNAFQNDCGQIEIAATPGRVVRRDWWLTKDQIDALERLPDAQERSRIDSDSDAEQRVYQQESARLGAALASTQAELKALQGEIDRRQAELALEGVIRRLAEQAYLERQLMLAEQRRTLLALQQAVLLEEIEAIDIAFVALAVITATQ